MSCADADDTQTLMCVRRVSITSSVVEFAVDAEYGPLKVRECLDETCDEVIVLSFAIEIQVMWINSRMCYSGSAAGKTQ